ncbi:DMT family transporter [Xanthocytophaga agilis]|uniref:DMT family transporter n=1 Tax=Xanthocytophaga agilis TaxID=3048010 RepID=A0AAE3QYH6_9BACT|nr:DMT family transporter [Xanthocytophaga agilis]MDJ1499805.1 DMT family transporter [Xanthocytophaga agilis]
MTYLKLVLVSLFWAGGFIAGKILVNGEVGPYTAATNRFLIASICLMTILYQVEKRFPKLTLRQWLLVLVLGLSGVFLYNIFFFNGLRYIPASRASLIVAITPAVTASLSAIFFKERITPLRWIGILISIVGAMIVISHGELVSLLNGGITLGDVLIFGCVITWAIYTLVGKLALVDLSPLVVAAYSSCIGLFTLGILGISEGALHSFTQLSWQLWAAILFMAIFSTALGYIWFYEGVRSIGPSQAAVFGNLVPVFAVLLAVMILNENVDVYMIGGGLLVLAGVSLTNRRNTQDNVK